MLYGACLEASRHGVCMSAAAEQGASVHAQLSVPQGFALAATAAARKPSPECTNCLLLCWRFIKCPEYHPRTTAHEVALQTMSKHAVLLHI